jgi:hypothetical protein
LCLSLLLVGSGLFAAEEPKASWQEGACGVNKSQGMMTPIFLSDLHPECCRSISSTPESTCDSVSFSPGRCEEYNGGGQCAWTCHCCQPQSSQYSYSFCGQLDAYGPRRCNEVYQGTACTWTC